MLHDRPERPLGVACYRRLDSGTLDGAETCMSRAARARDTERREEGTGVGHASGPPGL